MISVGQISQLYAALLDSEGARQVSLDFANSGDAPRAANAALQNSGLAASPQTNLTQSTTAEPRTANTAQQNAGLATSAQTNSTQAATAEVRNTVQTNATSGQLIQSLANVGQAQTAQLIAAGLTAPQAQALLPATQSETSTALANILMRALAGPQMTRSPGQAGQQTDAGSNINAQKRAAQNAAGSDSVQGQQRQIVQASSTLAAPTTQSATLNNSAFSSTSAQPASEQQAQTRTENSLNTRGLVDGVQNTGGKAANHSIDDQQFSQSVNAQTRHPSDKQAFSTSLSATSPQFPQETGRAVEKAFGQNTAAGAVSAELLRSGQTVNDGGLAVNFGEFIEASIHGGGARDAGGLLSLVALNAAFIPGWPAPQPFTPVPPKNIEKIRQALTDGEIKDEAKAMEYLASLGFNKALMERIYAALQKVDDKIKFLIWITAIATVMTRILKTLSREVVDPAIAYEDELPDESDDEPPKKNKGKRRVLRI